MQPDALQPPNGSEPCPLCGSAPHPLAPVHGRPLRHCPRCDLISVPRQWHLSREDEKARYLLHENTIDNAGYVERFHRFIAIIREKVPEAHRILDYGCGPTPIFVDLLRQAGYDATGYDPIFAPDRDPSDGYDLIVSVETFEHFAEPGNELRRIVSLLPSGGGLAIMTMFHHGPDSMKDWWYARDRTHVAFYSTATIRYIESAFGFDAIALDEPNIAVLRKKG